jgi:pyruvate/2-oxoglutarate dehydrogenase complex dihydrolipoamide acyltransferase (E2) component
MHMKIKLRLVRVGMNMTEATIARWFKQSGERFVAGEPLYAIETEKVTQEVEATAAGTLVEILAPAGTDVAVGAPVCTVDLEHTP